MNSENFQRILLKQVFEVLCCFIEYLRPSVQDNVQGAYDSYMRVIIRTLTKQKCKGITYIPI